MPQLVDVITIKAKVLINLIDRTSKIVDPILITRVHYVYARPTTKRILILMEIVTTTFLFMQVNPSPITANAVFIKIVRCFRCVAIHVSSHTIYQVIEHTLASYTMQLVDVVLY